MKRRAEFRNEVKTRLTDPVFDALQRYKALHGIESDSAALARIAGTTLLGVIGILPADISGVSATVGRSGPSPRA